MHIKAGPYRARQRMNQMATYQGTCACHICGTIAHVFTNRNGLAYHKCGPCGVKVEHFNMRTSQKFLKTITPHIDPDAEPPAKPVNPGKSPEPIEPAKPKKAGFFDGLNIG
jgi:hypothetical protein